MDPQPSVGLQRIVILFLLIGSAAARASATVVVVPSQPSDSAHVTVERGATTDDPARANRRRTLGRRLQDDDDAVSTAGQAWIQAYSQCGGRGSTLTGQCGFPGFGPCVDAAWSKPTCRSGLRCARVDEKVWWCEPPSMRFCPGIAGYTATPDVDHWGDDIGNFGSSVLARCDNDPACLGFNSNGWVKRVAAPLTPIASGYRVCFYTKNPRGSARLELWDQCGGKGSTGQGRCGLSGYGSCVDAAWGNPTCKDGQRCARDNEWWWQCEPPSTRACPAIAGYTGIADMDHLGDNIGNFGADAAARCTADARCLAFNTDGWIKNATGPIVPVVEDYGICFYTKDSVKGGLGCPVALPGYVLETDKDNAGVNASNLIADPASACSLRADCRGYSTSPGQGHSRGWLKKQVTPIYAAPGTCFYTRVQADPVVPPKDGEGEGNTMLRIILPSVIVPIVVALIGVATACYRRRS